MKKESVSIKRCPGFIIRRGTLHNSRKQMDGSIHPSSLCSDAEAPTVSQAGSIILINRLERLLFQCQESSLQYGRSKKCTGDANVTCMPSFLGFMLASNRRMLGKKGCLCCKWIAVGSTRTDAQRRLCRHF